jgi:hypothetical protein
MKQVINNFAIYSAFIMWAAIQAQAIDYSVNIMWINENLTSDQKYLKPAANEKELENGLLTPVRKWRAATMSDATITFWYDGDMIPPGALENTKELFQKDTLNHPEWAAISFKDIRYFPEVSLNPRVFSKETPIYFRADLLREIAAYNSILEHPHQIFVYADLDVTPMSKEQLFDPETLENLKTFGIVFARGGIAGFENSFQITKKNEKLLSAMKVALIDVSIARAKNILEGGSWAYKDPGDTQPLTQSVFDTLNNNMLPYFYYLEGWAKLGSKHSFGINSVLHLNIQPTSDKIIEKFIAFDYQGKEKHIERLRIPTKIIDAPPSRFGGTPTKFDQHEIIVENFHDKLRKALNASGEFDASFLYLAAKNNYIEAVKEIAEKLDPKRLSKAFLTPIKKYESYRNNANALNAALVEGNADVIQIIANKLSQEHKFLDKVALGLQDKYKLNTTFIQEAARRKHGNVLSVLTDILWDNQDALVKLGHAVAELPEDLEDNQKNVKNFALFKRISDHVPKMLLELTDDGESVALKAAKYGHGPMLNEIASRAPQTLEIKNAYGEFPLLLIKMGYMAPRFFKNVWEASPKMQIETDNEGNTIAHMAARSEYGSDALQFLAEQNSPALTMLNHNGMSPAATAVQSKHAPELAVIVSARPQEILSEFSFLLKKAHNCFDCLLVLAKAFPQHVPEIINTVGGSRTPEEIQKIQNFSK